MSRRLCFPRPNSRGFTLIELLLGLAISAILMLSLAFAFYAASNSISSNHSYYKATQTGRLTLARMSKAIRNAAKVRIGAAKSTVADGTPGSGSALYVFATDTTTPAAYIYDRDGGILYYDTMPESELDIAKLKTRMSDPPSVYVLARDVRKLEFTCTSKDDGKVNSVNILMVVGNPDDTTFTCDQAVVLRKAVPRPTAPAPAPAPVP